jgi:hypothetical protein
MIDERVIDKLNPLRGEALIILRDPQRMSHAGARAVDGWDHATLSAQSNTSPPSVMR